MSEQDEGRSRANANRPSGNTQRDGYNPEHTKQATSGKHALSRKNSTGGTSEVARDHMNSSGRAKTLEQLVLELVEQEPATGEEMLVRIRALGVDTVLYSIKPRFSRLKRLGLVVDSGERGLSESGKFRSVRWRATTAAERVAWAAERAEATDV